MKYYIYNFFVAKIIFLDYYFIFIVCMLCLGIYFLNICENIDNFPFIYINIYDNLIAIFMFYF